MSDFDSIFRNYHQVLVVYAYKFVLDEEAALDVVQDVFTHVWEKQKFDFEEEHLKAYLFNATRNTCLNFLKHQKVRQTHDEFVKLKSLEVQHYASGEKSLIEKESLDKIHRAIAALPAKYREVIELSRFEGLKNKEIAEQLQIPLRTVETQLFRGLSMLREHLTKQEFKILLSIFSLNKK